MLTLRSAQPVLVAAAILAAVNVATLHADPVGTAFTYQGRLTSGGTPAAETYDMQFALYAGAAGGSPLGVGVLCVDDIMPVEGLFTVDLDFGSAAMNGDERWLEIRVRADSTPGNCTVGLYTTLTPRQRLSAAPYAQFSGKPWATSGNNISNTNTGNVGIGTAAPGDRLTVAGNFGIERYGTGAVGRIKASLAEGTISNPTAIPSNAILVNVEAYGHDGTDFFRGAYIGIRSTEAWTPTGHGTEMRFNTRANGTTTEAERMRIAHDGNVGIGTTTPSRKLTVHEFLSGQMTLPLQLQNTSTTNGAAVGTAFRVNSADNAKGALVYERTAGNGRGSFHFLQNNIADDTGVSIDDAAMTLTRAGSLGIGTASPASTELLHVVGEGNVGLERYGSPPAYSGRRANGSAAAPIPPDSGNGLVQLNGRGWDGTSFQTAGQVIVAAQESWSPTARGSSIRFLTTPTGTTSITEQMRIAPDGKVGIGTSTPECQVHVHKGSAGAVTAATDAVMVLENSSQAFMQILTPEGGVSGVGFGNPGHTLDGGIYYNLVYDGLAFRTNGNLTRMVIDSDGNVGIGTTAPTVKLDVNGTFRAVGLRTEDDADSPNVIGGFAGNTVTSGVVGATIGGGGNSANTNRVTDDYGTVGGGFNNQAGDAAGSTSFLPYATVGGGAGNIASGYASTVGGGTTNTASGHRSTVGGGMDNRAGGHRSTVGGGMDNRAGAFFSTVGGGDGNRAIGSFSTVGGGEGNTADGIWSTVGGGVSNTASADSSTVGGGGNNTASGFRSTVGGGASNTASGDWSNVPGGAANQAGADMSFAAGRQAKANHSGAFVWGDSTLEDVASSADNQFIVRASGGLWFGTTSSPSVPAGRFINTSTGAYLSTGGTWTNASSRKLKENFSAVDVREVLSRVASLPIQKWNYRAEDATTVHIGSTAEDFAAAFGLGADNASITTIDADGVALAAIQGLYEIVKEKDACIAEQQRTIGDLTARLERLERIVQKAAEANDGGVR
jgi:hypothetical protein